MHSTFSDGRDPIEGNVEEAEALGLTELTCVDHVRAGTDWVPDYVAAVRRIRATTDVELRCGIEAKLLDTTGALDLPDAYDGVDAIYAADHQVPLADGPNHPREVRARIEARRAGGRRGARGARRVDRAGARPARAGRHRPLPQHPPEARPGRGRRPARAARRPRRRDRADRPGDRGLRALALPGRGDARAVPAPRRADPAQHRQPLARDDRPLRPLPRGAARARRACRRDRRRADPLRVRGRRRAPARRRLLPVRARRAAPLPLRRRRPAARSCRTSRSSSPPGTRRR